MTRRFITLSFKEIWTRAVVAIIVSVVVVDATHATIEFNIPGIRRVGIAIVRTRLPRKRHVVY